MLYTMVTPALASAGEMKRPMSMLFADDPTPLDFEVGPIRPPSEARSLLVRVSRNCPWNKCTFCPVYKRRKFSRRPVEDVESDVEAMGRVRDRLREVSEELGHGGRLTQPVIRRVMQEAPLHAGIGQVAMFLMAGGKTVFLQDANSLLLKPPELERVVRKIMGVFPEVTRITSYARSQTLARTPVEGLRSLFEAGLNRIHVGLETGSDELLRRVRKGCTKEQHILGGRNVIEAGLELSEYVMPGLGGVELWKEHAD
ncbi:MAG: radical SAM protein, partial [bacterium]